MNWMFLFVKQIEKLFHFDKILGLILSEPLNRTAAKTFLGLIYIHNRLHAEVLKSEILKPSVRLLFVVRMIVFSKHPKRNNVVRIYHTTYVIALKTFTNLGSSKFYKFVEQGFFLFFYVIHCFKI